MAINDRAINVILRFLTDEGSKKQAQQAVQELEAGVKSIGTQAAAASQQTAAVGQDLVGVGRDILDTSRLMGKSAEEFVNSQTAALTFAGMTKDEMWQAVDAAKEADSATGKMSDNIEQATFGMTEFRRELRGITAGFILLRAGRQLRQIGAAAFGPIGAFTGFAGPGTQAAAQWQAAMGDLQQSAVRVGRVMTREVLPVIRAVADLSETVADLIEQHPLIARASIGLAGGTAAVGVLLQAAGQIAIGAFTIKTILATIGGATGAGAAGGAAGGPLSGIGGAIGGAGARLAGGAAGLLTSGVGAGLLGLPVGVGIYNLIAKAADLESAGTIAGQTLTVLAFKAGELFGPDKAAEWGRSIGVLTGAIDDLSQASEGAGTVFSAEATQAFIDFRKEAEDAEEEYAKQRAEVIDEYGKERVRLERQYEERRADLIRSFERTQSQATEDFRTSAARDAREFARNESQAEEDYYTRRRELARDFRIDVQRAEEDHQREMRRMREEHEARLEDLVDARDALGIEREQRDYERRRREAEEEYQVEAARRSEDFARRIADLERHFAEERARRQAEFARRQAEAEREFALEQQRARQEFELELKRLEEEHESETELLDEQHERKLREMQEQYNKERIERREAFADQLRDLNEFGARERELRNAYYAAMEADLRNWVNRWAGVVGSSQPGFPGRQSGGYVGDGIYRMHPNEYVLNANTTEMLERIVGGRLTQTRIMAAVAGRGLAMGGRTNIHVHQNNWKFEGNMSAEVRREMRRMAREAASDGIMQVLER